MTSKPRLESPLVDVDEFLQLSVAASGRKRESTPNRRRHDDSRSAGDAVEPPGAPWVRRAARGGSRRGLRAREEATERFPDLAALSVPNLPCVGVGAERDVWLRVAESPLDVDDAEVARDQHRGAAVAKVVRSARRRDLRCLSCSVERGAEVGAVRSSDSDPLTPLRSNELAEKASRPAVHESGVSAAPDRGSRSCREARD
jgi:hypothetical protein